MMLKSWPCCRPCNVSLLHSYRPLSILTTFAVFSHVYTQITMRFPFLIQRATKPTDPLFFYNLQPNACSLNGESFPAPNNTVNGDLCAYIPNTNPLLLY